MRIVKKEYVFKKGEWNREDFEYVYSPRCVEFKEFKEESDCLVNAEGKALFGYEYISLITKQKYGVGTKAYTRCSFESFGAPLIVLSEDIGTDAEGRRIYGKHFEVVAYEDGCNVWYIVPAPKGSEDPVIPTLIFEEHCNIEEGSPIDIWVEVEEKKLRFSVNGKVAEVEHAEIPAQFQIGFTACEGINRFFRFDVEE